MFRSCASPSWCCSREVSRAVQWGLLPRCWHLQKFCDSEISESREWFEQLPSKLWICPIDLLKTHPLHFLLLKITKAQGFCFVDYLVVFCLFLMFHLFFYYKVSPFLWYYWVNTLTSFWVVTNICRHTKFLHFIWHLTWAKSSSTTFFFFSLL